MPVYKKLALFGALVGSIYADEEEHDYDLHGDPEEEGDEKPAGGMPGMEGLDMEALLAQMGGGEGGMDMEKLQEMMAQMGGGMGGEGGAPPAGGPPQPKKAALEEVTEEHLTKSLETRIASQALYVFKGDAEMKTLAEKLVEEEGQKLFAEFAYLEAAESDISIYKGTAEESSFGGDFTDFEAVKKFATEGRLPAFGQIDDSNFEIYVESAKTGIFWACFDSTKQDEEVAKYSPALVEAFAAQTGAEQYPFVWIDGSKYKEHMEQELGIKDNFPTLVLQKGNLMAETEEDMLKVQKFVRSFSQNPEELNAEAVTKFFADVASGDLKAEPVPDPLDALDDDDDEEDTPAEEAKKDEEL